MDRNLMLSLGLVCTLVTGPALAQSTAVLGKDNAEFARKLFEAGYPEYSDGLCKTITQNGGSGTELLEIKVLGFELQVAALKKSQDLAERVQGLRKVIDAENAF